MSEQMLSELPHQFRGLLNLGRELGYDVRCLILLYYDEIAVNACGSTLVDGFKQIKKSADIAKIPERLVDKLFVKELGELMTEIERDSHASGRAEEATRTIGLGFEISSHRVGTLSFEDFRRGVGPQFIFDMACDGIRVVFDLGSGRELIIDPTSDVVGVEPHAAKLILREED